MSTLRDGFIVVWDPDSENPNPHQFEVHHKFFLTYEEAEEAAELITADEDAVEFRWPYLIAWFDSRWTTR